MKNGEKYKKNVGYGPTCLKPIGITGLSYYFSPLKEKKKRN